jgi:hypothetical protein
VTGGGISDSSSKLDGLLRLDKTRFISVETDHLTDFDVLDCEIGMRKEVKSKHCGEQAKSLTAGTST